MPLFNPLVAIRTRAAPTWDAGVLLGSFSAGTALLSHGPLAVIPLDEDKDSRCSRCLLRCEATVRTCGRCKCEVYCSDACRDAAWSEYHSHTCQYLPSIYYSLQANRTSSADTHAAKLLVRLISARFMNNAGHTERLAELSSKTMKEIRTLPATSKVENQVEVFFELVPSVLCAEEKVIVDLVSAKIASIPKTSITFLLERFSSNNHIISDERLRPIGHAILPEISRVCNHSCAPTGVVSTMWDSNTRQVEVSIRAIRPLQAGEELTIPYLDPILPLNQRQTFLLERYGFTCTCSLCKYQSALPSAQSKQVAESRPNDLARLFQLVVSKGLEQEVSQLKATSSGSHMSLDSFMNSTSRLPSRVSQEKIPLALISCLRPDLVHELTDMFGETAAGGDWPAACMLGMHVLAIYVAVYGWRYPLVGLHLLELAKVVFNAHMAASGSQTPGLTEMLLHALIYNRWAQESLSCSVARGGSLCGADDMGPIADSDHLQQAVREEIVYIMS